MSERTKIAWADSTCNLCMGCSQQCELAGGHCYAEALCKRMAGHKGYPADFRKPKLFLHRLDEALRWPDLTGTDRPDKPWLNGLLRIIVLNFLGETFDPALPEDWLLMPGVVGQTKGYVAMIRGETIPSVLEQLAASPHIYIILTKQAKRMAEFSARHPFPANVWVGVSVMGPETMDRLKWLSGTKTHGRRIVSFEPLLAPVDVSAIIGYFDWAIIGLESGRNHRTGEVEWIRSPVEQAHAAGVPAFVKQDAGLKPGQQGRIPDDLWNVKEMPR